MTFRKEKQKFLLGASLAVLVLVNGYRLMTSEAPRTAPLTYERGSVASSPVRPAAGDRGAADPLQVFVGQTARRYPGVTRDIFRMYQPAMRPKPKPVEPIVPVVVTAPVPVRTAEEIAADLARADLAKFRYIGYLTDKDTTSFLSKDGELFMGKPGDNIGSTYKIKEVTKDFVVIVDTVTRVEGKVSLSGEGVHQQQQSQAHEQKPSLPAYQTRPAMPLQVPTQAQQQPGPAAGGPPEKAASDRIQKRRQRTLSRPDP